MVGRVGGTFVWVSLLVVATGAAAIPLHAQGPGIRPIGPEVRVPTPLPAVEPHLSVDEDDHRRRLVGSMLVGEEGELTCQASFTADGGRSWSVHTFDVTDCADPWTAFRPGGAAVMLMLGAPQIGWGKRLLLFRSEDGTTWSETGQVLGDGFDHPTLRIGEDGLIEVTATRGATSGAALVRVTVTEDGEVFLADRLIDDYQFVAMNTVETRFAPLTPVVVFGRGGGFLPEQRTLVLSGAEVMSARSTEVTRACGLGGGFPSIVIVGHDGTEVAFACIDAELGRTLVYRSSDPLVTWEGPTRANERPRPGDIRTPLIASQGSMVLTSWQERGVGDAAHCQRLMGAMSADGARSFGLPEPISEVDSCPEQPGEAPGVWAGGGHYAGIQSLSDGAFTIVWADHRSGGFELLMRDVAATTR